MKEIEKTLIIDLFKKLKNTSLQTPNKDLEAKKLILSLLNNQNDSVYYMVQTLLVQDILIQELNEKVKALENQTSDNVSKNTSFLSNHLKCNTVDSSKNNVNMNRNIPSKKIEPNISEYQYPSNRDNTSRNNQSGISSFLGTAVQTAVGVAGGMVAGNMLTNFLHNHYDKENNVLEHDNHIESNNDHSDGAVNNFFQVDPEDEIHDQSFETDELDDLHDFDEDFN